MKRHNDYNPTKPKHLGVRMRADAWSPLPMVGKVVGPKATNDYLRLCKASKVDGSGSSNLYKTEDGKWATDPKMSMYLLDDSLLPPDLDDAKFIQVGLQEVKINVVETRQQKSKRNNDKKAKPFIREGRCHDLFGIGYEAAKSRIQSLNEFWQQHPIELPNGHMAACAKRVYHDGRLDAGGRLHGAWTGLEKDKRLQCKIDGEPICELDIKASKPTLLSALLGERISNTKIGYAWQDVYVELSILWAVGNAWTENDNFANPTEQMMRNRAIAKKVVVELIGNGTPLKSRSTKELADEYGLSRDSWLKFRDAMLNTVPALNELEPRYDDKGNISGYLNGAGFLSYHESEMMMLTLEELVSMNISAYPVHDCLMVKIQDSKIAASVFRDVIRQYCHEQSGIDVLVPLSVETTTDITFNEEDLPSEEEVVGVYLS